MVTMFPLCVFVGKQPSDSSNIASVIVYGGAVRHSLTSAFELKPVPAVLVRRARICVSCSLCWPFGLMERANFLATDFVSKSRRLRKRRHVNFSCSFGWPRYPGIDLAQVLASQILERHQNFHVVRVTQPVTQLLERLGFDLTNSLSGQPQSFANLFQRVRLVAF